MKQYLIYWLPLFLLLLLVVFPVQMAIFSHSFIGVLLLLILVLIYLSLDRLYGVFLFLLVILYYQDRVITAAMEGFDSYHPNTINTEASPKMSAGYVSPVSEVKNPFQQKYCHMGSLQYKGYDISKENAEHLFPSLKFSDAGICDPCEPACKYSITEIVNLEETVLPKSSKFWMEGGDLSEWIGNGFAKMTDSFTAFSS